MATDFIPQIIPTENTDRIVSSMRCFGDVMLQMEMEFDFHLDADRLTRAAHLLCDAEPVLGCRLVNAKIPYWERIEREDRKLFLPAATAGEYENIRNLSLYPSRQSQIQLCLLRTEGGDRLLVKVAHEIADAGGVKDIVAALSNIYNMLVKEPDYKPTPNLAGDRSANQLMKKIPLLARLQIFYNYLREGYNTFIPLGGHFIPMTKRTDDKIKFLIRNIEAEKVQLMKEFGQSYGATINDIMMTAVIRAHAKVGNWQGKKPLRFWTTIDNRRYLPGRHTGGICNLSAVEILNFGNSHHQNFGESLRFITALSRRRKESWVGLNTYIGLFPLMKILSYRNLLKFMDNAIKFYQNNNIVQAALTNLGPIEPEKVSFDAPPIKACLIVPPVFPPLLGLGLSGYNGSLTISAGVYPSSNQEIIMIQLIENIIDESISECIPRCLRRDKRAT